MEDKNILDVDYRYYSKLELLLNAEETRREFLSVLPPEIFDSEARDKIETDGSNSPGRRLLFYLGSQNASVSDFIHWFEAARLDNALMILEHDAPLNIIKQPPATVELKQGENLSIICEATSFPRPEYQWFKGEQELLEEVFPELSISSVKVEDSGLYYCEVSKRSADNSCTSEYSNSVKVEVTIPEGEFHHPRLDVDSDSPILSFKSTQLDDTTNFEVSAANTSSLEKNYSQSEKIRIIHQPQGYARVSQGFKFYLECVAYHPSPVYYEWYKDGRILKGKVDPKLVLDFMFPDPLTGETKFVYQCKVYNDYDHVLSSPAVIKLEEPNEHTRYFAEDKIALLIGNDSYEAYQALETPEADITDLVALLKEMQFKVFAFKNLTYTEMQKVLCVFFNMITEDSYALFYFGGHGTERPGQTYLLPVDCSGYCSQEETICVEYILQNMQERRPALNVLLIDACRKIIQRDESMKVYEALTRNNTVYGYSTSFLCSSYEGDERNSFFVKHLKRYIAQDKTIQDVIFHVQKAFNGEKHVRTIQNPVITSSLSVPRKLRDPHLSSDTLRRNNFQDKEVRQQFINFECPVFKCVFIIENKKLDVFFNGVELSVYVKDLVSSDSKALDHVMINLKLLLPQLQVSPTEGERMTNLKHRYRNFLLKKEVIGIQKLCESEELKGILEICINTFAPIKEPFSMNVGKTWIYFESIANSEKLRDKQKFYKLKSDKINKSN